jgi:polar amino acid transport system permease protein
MIAGLNVITDNLDYLLWGRLAAGEPGGVLLTLLMALGAAALALPGGIGLACLAWRFPGWYATRSFCGQSLSVVSRLSL